MKSLRPSDAKNQVEMWEASGSKDEQMSAMGFHTAESF